METHYTVLGLQITCSEKDVKRAFRKLAVQNHPDKQKDSNDDQSNQPPFWRITQAYEVLSDPERRRAYDEELEQREKIRTEQRSRESVSATDQGSTDDDAEAGGIFDRRHVGTENDFIRAEFASRKIVSRGTDVRVTVRIPLKEFWNGKPQKIAFTARRRCTFCPAARGCSECRGTGMIPCAETLDFLGTPDLLGASGPLVERVIPERGNDGPTADSPRGSLILCIMVSIMPGLLYPVLGGEPEPEPEHGHGHGHGPIVAPRLILSYFVPRSLEGPDCGGCYFEFQSKLIDDNWLFAVQLPLVGGKLYSSKTGPVSPLGPGAIRLSVRFTTYQGSALSSTGGQLKDVPDESAHILRAE